MAVVPFYTKYPTEKFAIGLDFTEEMPSGATLSSGVCSAIYRKTEATATAVILPNSTTPTLDIPNNIARITTEAGAAGTWYEVHFTMTCSNGAIIKGRAVLFVDN
jgi:hypothetical protein